MLHKTTFWLDMLLALPFWFILLSIAGFSFRQLRALKEWYVGIPFMQWFGMWCIVLGCKIVKSDKYVHFMPYDGRYWLSPNVKGFEIPKDV